MAVMTSLLKNKKEGWDSGRHRTESPEGPGDKVTGKMGKASPWEELSSSDPPKAVWRAKTRNRFVTMKANSPTENKDYISQLPVEGHPSQ